jgi:hypothetical protein
MSDQNLLDLVEGNARVINEIYESVLSTSNIFRAAESASGR